MMNALESTLIVCGSIIAALLCLIVYRRYWYRHHQQNDIIGWHITFLATTYAVVIAFMLADVWNNYRAAEANAVREANALTNLYRTCAGLPAPQAKQIRSLAVRYGQLMIAEEWPAMLRNTFSNKGTAAITQIWADLTGTRVTDATEQAVLSRALEDVTNMSECRRIRHLQMRDGLPGVFWFLLIAGGVLTVLYTCLFDIERLSLHIFQVTGTAFIVALVLVTIADVDGPYGGALRIAPTGFVLALQTMK